MAANTRRTPRCPHGFYRRQVACPECDELSTKSGKMLDECKQAPERNPWMYCPRVTGANREEDYSDEP